jgi:hypothetical protein
MTTIIHTNLGLLTEHEGTLYLHTPCCGHLTTTTANGVECNNCGKQVDPFYAKRVSTDDPDAAAQFTADAKAFLNSTR